MTAASIACDRGSIACRYVFHTLSSRFLYFQFSVPIYPVLGSSIPSSRFLRTQLSVPPYWFSVIHADRLRQIPANYVAPFTEFLDVMTNDPEGGNVRAALIRFLSLISGNPGCHPDIRQLLYLLEEEEYNRATSV